MKREYLFGVLFFGSLWGVAEAGLGGYLYKHQFAHPSVPLTIIAFIILTMAKIYLPQRWSATFVGSVAMLYKFLNTPFFACHLLAIFLLGLSYDLVFNWGRIKSKAVFAAAATYLGYILFAFTITYLFRYHYWAQAGLPKILGYIGIGGSLAALGNFFILPLSFQFGQILKSKTVNPFEFKSQLATAGTSLIILALWFLGIARWF